MGVYEGVEGVTPDPRSGPHGPVCDEGHTNTIHHSPSHSSLPYNGYPGVPSLDTTDIPPTFITY